MELNFKKVGLGLEFSVEKLAVGWEIKFSGSFLIVHWEFTW